MFASNIGLKIPEIVLKIYFKKVYFKIRLCINTYGSLMVTSFNTVGIVEAAAEVEGVCASAIMSVIMKKY